MMVEHWLVLVFSKEIWYNIISYYALVRDQGKTDFYVKKGVAAL